MVNSFIISDDPATTLCGSRKWWRGRI